MPSGGSEAIPDVLSTALILREKNLKQITVRFRFKVAIGSSRVSRDLRVALVRTRLGP